MVPKTMVLAALVAAVALAGCTSGSDGGSSSDDGTTTASGGIGGNVTVGNNTANATVSGSFTGTSTNSSTNASTPAPQTAEVSIEDNEFVNATVTIAAGGTVTWLHDGSNPHTVTADDEEFDSSPSCGANPLPLVSDCLEAGDSFSWTFDEPGSYTYHCKVHGGMTGTVIVVDA